MSEKGEKQLPDQELEKVSGGFMIDNTPVKQDFFTSSGYFDSEGREQCMTPKTKPDQCIMCINHNTKCVNGMYKP